MALSILIDYLRRLGLSGLVPWATEMITTGASEDEVMIDLEEQPAFRERFWMIYTRSNNGFPPISPQEVLDYESSAMEMARAFGVNLEMNKVGQLIANDVSLVEAQDRLTLAARAVYQEPAETRAALERLYGITTGDLINYWLDPKATLPVLQRRFASADIAGSAQTAGYRNALTQQQAERLFEAGVSEEQAAQGFGTLVESAELFEAVDQTEEDIDVDTQLELLTGNTELAQQVGRRGEKRAARFQEGGSFASGREGLAGLGSANR